MTASVLIVGASVAGVGAANELRRCGFSGRIVLADGQAHLPYDRPPLSKNALADHEHAISFHDAEHYLANEVELRLGSRATALDVGSRTVSFDDGREVSADAIVIATGARARRLPAGAAAGPVFVIRELDDVVGVRPLLREGARLALIGGGFIGAEVAATALKLGVHVTIIDVDDLPLSRVLGCAVAEKICAMHAREGVKLVCGTPVERVEKSGDGSLIVLSDGSTLEADVVVAGLGSVPNVEWLQGSGLVIGTGVVCDHVGRTSGDGIFAVGDIAAWPDPESGDPIRHEHWTAAREQARIVAQHLAGQPESEWKAFVPYFWSDIHGKRVQLLGTTKHASETTFVFENSDTGAFVAEYRHGEKLIGVVGCNAAVRVMRYAPLLSS